MSTTWYNKQTKPTCFVWDTQLLLLLWCWRAVLAWAWSKRLAWAVLLLLLLVLVLLLLFLLLLVGRRQPFICVQQRQAHVQVETA